MQTAAFNVSGRGFPRAHPIRPDLRDLNLRQVERDVRREVGGGVVDLVEDLLCGRATVDEAAGAVRLRDDEGSVLFDFRDRVAEVVQARHVLDPGVGEVAARDL
jgi:hypothetical protein